MEYIRLGTTGLKVSRICLGAMTYGDPKWRNWVLPEAESRPFIQRALETGINFFDTSNMYSLGVSEEILGRALKPEEAREVMNMARRIASIILLQPELDENYRKVKAVAFDWTQR